MLLTLGPWAVKFDECGLVVLHVERHRQARRARRRRGLADAVSTGTPSVVPPGGPAAGAAGLALGAMTVHPSRARDDDVALQQARNRHGLGQRRV